MVQITVSDDLARAISEAGSEVTLVDSRGRTLGHIMPSTESSENGISAERRAEIDRRLREPGTYVSYQTIKERLGW